MERVFLSIFLIFSFFQVGLKNCEASCSLNHHEKMSEIHKCCKGKTKLHKNNQLTRKSGPEHKCLHQFNNLKLGLVSTSIEIQKNQDVVTADFESNNLYITLLHNFNISLNNTFLNTSQKSKIITPIYLNQRKLII